MGKSFFSRSVGMQLAQCLIYVSNQYWLSIIIVSLVNSFIVSSINQHFITECIPSVSVMVEA